MRGIRNFKEQMRDMRIAQFYMTFLKNLLNSRRNIINKQNLVEMVWLSKSNMNEFTYAFAKLFDLKRSLSAPQRMKLNVMVGERYKF